MPLITKGEYHALVKIWRYSPTCRPVGVRESTIWNLFGKGLIEHDNRPDFRHFWLNMKEKFSAENIR